MAADLLPGKIILVAVQCVCVCVCVGLGGCLFLGQMANRPLAFSRTMLYMSKLTSDRGTGSCEPRSGAVWLATAGEPPPLDMVLRLFFLLLPGLAPLSHSLPQVPQ